jgi:hypothetical protein
MAVKSTRSEVHLSKLRSFDEARETREKSRLPVDERCHEISPEFLILRGPRKRFAFALANAPSTLNFLIKERELLSRLCITLKNTETRYRRVVDANSDPLI